MLKKFFTKMMLQKQLKALPKEQQDAVLAAIDKNPAFFEKIGKEIEAKVKAGQDKMFATQAVVMQHREELAKLIQGARK